MNTLMNTFEKIWSRTETCCTPSLVVFQELCTFPIRTWCARPERYDVTSSYIFWNGEYEGEIPNFLGEKNYLHFEGYFGTIILNRYICWMFVRAVPAKIQAPPMDGNRFSPEGVVDFNWHFSGVCGILTVIYFRGGCGRLLSKLKSAVVGASSVIYCRPNTYI